MTKEKLQDRIRGALVGGAIGDAFVYPVEFVSSFEEIRAKYDDNGIIEYDLSYPWLEDTYDKALFLKQKRSRVFSNSVPAENPYSVSAYFGQLQNQP